MSTISRVLIHYGFEKVPDHGGDKSIKCVFHGDRHNSGCVNPDKGLYYCFTCGVKGDSISIVREQENCDFSTAVRLVEEITGASYESLREAVVREGSFLSARKGTGRASHKQLPAWKRGSA